MSWNIVYYESWIMKHNLLDIIGISKKNLGILFRCCPSVCVCLSVSSHILEMVERMLMKLGIKHAIVKCASANLKQIALGFKLLPSVIKLYSVYYVKCCCLSGVINLVQMLGTVKTHVPLISRVMALCITRYIIYYTSIRFFVLPESSYKQLKGFQ